MAQVDQIAAPAQDGRLPDRESEIRATERRVVDRAREAYALVRRRRTLLGDRLFFDPAWNMLLDLFISECEGRRLSVSAVCIGSHSSSATALRYAGLLAQAGLIGRVADGSDGRRSHVHLTARGWTVMRQLLS